MWLDYVNAGAVLTLFASVIAALGASMKDEVDQVRLFKNRHLQRRGVTTFGILLGAVGAMWSAYSQGQSQKTIAARNAEILKLNQEVMASVTGGDSYVGVECATAGGSHVFLVYLTHKGKYPVYDVNVNLTDGSCVKGLFALHKDANGIPHVSEAEMTACTSPLHLGNMGHNKGMVEIWRGDMAKLLDVRLSMQIMTRNAYINGQVRAIYANGHVSYAYRNEGMVNGASLHEPPVITGYFPKKADGTVDW